MRLTRTLIAPAMIGLAVAVAALTLACAGSSSKQASSQPGGPADAKGGTGDRFAAPSAVPAQAVPGEAPAAADAVASTAGGAPSTADPTFQALLNRKIVQNSSLDLGVSEVGRAFQDIIGAATTAGGFVASSSFSNQHDQQVADLTIRVPADKYQDVLARVRGMGTVGQEGSDANDVTQEYTDLQARLRTLQATEQRYLELLVQAQNINDILALQDRLDSVRGQIEQTQGRINLLDHLTDLATITVHIRPLAAASGPSGGVHPLQAAQSAWQHSLEALRGVAAAALVIAVFSWWLVPPAIALGLGARWWLGRRPRAAVPQQPA